MTNAIREPKDDVLRFIDCATSSRRQSKIPTALIVTSPSASTEFLLGVQQEVSSNDKRIFLTLNPSDGPNLKTLLKNLIQRATQTSRDDEDDEPTGKLTEKGYRLLNYDLQILHQWITAKGIQKIVLALRDGEMFDVNVLSDFVILLQSVHL